MIDYKNKDLSVKTNKDKIAKLMVQANKRNNNLKQRQISPQDLQPMEKKENYKTEPSIPTNQKISADDWNAFVNNVTYLDDEEKNIIKEVQDMEKELQLLASSNKLINEKIKLVPIITNYDVSKYIWWGYANSFYRIDSGDDSYSVRYGFTVAGAVISDDILETIKKYRKLVITFKEIDNGKQTGKVKKSTIYTNGDIQELKAGFGVGASIPEVNRGTLYTYGKFPLNYTMYGNIGGFPNAKFGFYSAALGAPDYYKIDGRFNTGRYKGVAIALKTGIDVPSRDIPRPQFQTTLFMPITGPSWEIYRSDREPESLPGNFTGWAVSDVYGAMEEPQDLVSLNNWVNFVRLQLQFNSKWSDNWGKDNEPEDEDIKKYLAGDTNTTTFEISNYKGSKEEKSSTTIQVISLGDKRYKSTWIGMINGENPHEQKIELTWGAASDFPTSAVPSKFFSAIFTANDFTGSFVGLNSSSANNALYEQLEVYNTGYTNLWTNANQRVIDWNWYFKTI